MLCLAVLCGCDDGGGAAPVVVIDGIVDQAVVDASPVDAAPQDAEPRDMAPDAGPPPPSVLLLDVELRPALAWGALIEAFADAERPVRYRRGYPHLVDADLRPEQVIVVAGGGAPGRPTTRLRAMDEARMRQHVEGGGALVLLTQNGWRDGQRFTFDRGSFNRVLSSLGLPVRVMANTLVGDVALPMDPLPPLHQTHPWSYPGPLEWTLDLPVGFPAREVPVLAELGPFAAGWTCGLACDGLGAVVLARSHADAFVWRQLGPGDDRVTLPGAAQPLVVLARHASGGRVLVAPRSVFEMPVHSLYGGEKPVLEIGLLDGTRALADATVQALLDPEVELGRCAAGPRPLSPAPEDADDRAVGGLPAGQLEERLPAPGGSSVPGWFRDGQARIAYGEQLGDNARLQQLGDAGFDAVVIRFNWPDYSAPSAAGDARLRGAIEAAHAAGLRALLTVHYRHEGWAQVEPEIGRARGPYRAIDAPPPLADTWWTEGIAPLFSGAVRAARLFGADGLLLDMELYGAGVSMYGLGHLADDHAWQVLGGDLAVPAGERLEQLVASGRALTAFRALEDEVAARTAMLVADAPELTWGLYMPFLPDGWFYRGLIRGLGHPERPAIVLSYDHGTAAVRTAWAGEGLHARVIGGVLGTLFRPADLETAVQSLRARSDGYWLFPFNDFLRDDEGANLHGAPSDYRQRLGRLNAD